MHRKEEKLSPHTVVPPASFGGMIEHRKCLGTPESLLWEIGEYYDKECAVDGDSEQRNRRVVRDR